MNDMEYYWLYLLCRKMFDLEFDITGEVVQITIPMSVNLTNIDYGRIFKFLYEYSLKFKGKAKINKVYLLSSESPHTYYSISELNIDCARAAIIYDGDSIGEDIRRIITNLSGLSWVNF